MFDGNMFFDEQGMPILKIALKRMLLDDALPEPFSVATQMFTSLINGVSKIRPPYATLWNSGILTCYLGKTTVYRPNRGYIGPLNREIPRLPSRCAEPVHQY